MDLGSAVLAILVGVLIKGAVMVLGVRMMFRLYRSTYAPAPRGLWLLLPQENLPEVRLLWWSLVLFCISEFTCGVEIYVLFHSSPLMGGVHAVTSALAMGLFALGLYVYCDRKLLHFGGRECLANCICHGCTIQTACRYRLTLMLAATFLGLASIPPLFVSTARMAADTRAWMLPFPGLNAWYDQQVVPWLVNRLPGYQPSGAAYFLPRSVQIIEYRVLPLVVLVLSAVALYRLRGGAEGSGLRLLAFSAGVLCFSYSEIVLNRAMGDLLFGSLGHEVAEFWFLVTAAEFLTRTFDRARSVPV